MSEINCVPETEEIIQLNDISYNCTKCSSPIEVLSLNEKNCFIEFNCIKNNHKIKISIKDYLNQMKDLKNKNANNDICEDKQHNLKYEYYCINCKTHLCKVCLKSRNHINHFKYSLFEMQPNKNEFNIIENIIKDYENKIGFLEKEKIKINKKYKEAKIKLNERKELSMKKDEINMEKEIKLKIDEYLLNLNNLRTQYENDIKSMKERNKKNINEIKKKYMRKNEYNNFYYNIKIEILDNKYNKIIQKYKFNEKIEHINNLKKLNAIIYNTFDTYKNNYFNIININNILIYNLENKNILDNNDIKDIYDNLIKIKCEKEIIIKGNYNLNFKNININNKNNLNNKINFKKTLENINYSYIPKLIFSYIFGKRKLELAKYNKKLQNIININIMHYKIFSKRYIIYEEKGKGKEYEYETDNLIFEGEYFNGKRNGKGKEYDKYNNKIFEVEYINGKKKENLNHYYGSLDFKINNLEFSSGISGKEYKFNIDLLNKMKNGEGKVSILKSDYPFDNLIMRGDVLNYEMNGKCELYYERYKPKFIGNYLKGKLLNGTGYDRDKNILYELENGGRDVKEYFKNKKLKIKINSINGKLKGEGKEYDNKGNIIFEGEYINDKKNGKGKEYYDNHELRFEGEYFNDYRFKGKEYTEGKLEYKGEYFFYKKWNGFGYNKNRDIIYQLIKGNGKIKEYSKNGILIFEGEYIDGKASKICKEYNEEGKIIYEGEYLKGKKTGKGKEYNKNGELIYEGDFLDGIRNGKGREYNENGILIFEGKYKNGKKQGEGIEYYINGKIIFEGEYYYDKREGKGKEYYYNGNLKYEGQFYSGNKSGQGKEYNQENKLIYEGEFNKGKREGKGKEYLDNKLIYEGEFIKGERNGEGKEYNDKKELIFEGEYLNGEKWKGFGKEYHYLTKEIIFEGEYLKGKKWKGKIKEYHNNNNLKYEGEYLEGEKCGNGKEYNREGKLIYDGQYLNGLKDGTGKEYNENGYLSFEGEFSKGVKMNGIGKEYDYSGNIIFEGEYYCGKKEGKGKEYDYKGNIIFEGEYQNGKKWNGIFKEYNNDDYKIIEYSDGKIKY